MANVKQSVGKQSSVASSQSAAKRKPQSDEPRHPEPSFPNDCIGNPVAQAIDRCFGDLINNVPALRSTENYNETIKAREALKVALVENKNSNKQQEA